MVTADHCCNGNGVAGSNTIMITIVSDSSFFGQTVSTHNMHEVRVMGSIPAMDKSAEFWSGALFFLPLQCRLQCCSVPLKAVRVWLLLLVTAKYQPVRIRTTGMSWYVASVGLVCAWLGVLVFFPLWKIFAQVPDLAQQARPARPGASPAVARPLARLGARPLAV